ncbi:hypothetical protein [Streptomyces sp. NPDC003719]
MLAVLVFGLLITPIARGQGELDAVEELVTGLNDPTLSLSEAVIALPVSSESRDGYNWDLLPLER